MRTVMIATMLLGLAIGDALADSIFWNVTPSNIGAQPLRFDVHSDASGEELLRFEIRVSGAEDSLSPIRSGTLTIWEKKAMPCDHTGARAGHPVVVASCTVAEEVYGELLQYSFTLKRSVVASASFTFYDMEPHGMPSFDAYDFILSDFMSSRR